jgi:phosphoribosylglycinamide formyltransferase-1
VRLGVLVSGRGSNLAAVLEAVAAGELPGVQPALVISNRSGIPALDIAARHGVPSLVLEAAPGNRAVRDEAIGRALADVGAEVALLAGYDQILGPSYFARFGGVTLNLHPSLLPRHGGPGMVGTAVHDAVLASGDRISGATVHEVTADVDAGPIVNQVEVPVEPGDTADSLAARIRAAEHRLVVDTLRGLVASRGP